MINNIKKHYRWGISIIIVITLFLISFVLINVIQGQPRTSFNYYISYINSFISYAWTQVDVNGSESGLDAPWTARYTHQVVSHNNAMWLLGGYDGSYKNDIWKSTDGTTWTQVDANGSEAGLNAPWSVRGDYQVVSFNNALWLLGGDDDDSPKNDIWKSTDGTTWTQVDANGPEAGLNAPWSARFDHQVVSHNNAMWLLGGYDGSYKNDIWKSTDGTTWTQVDANGPEAGLNAPWSVRGDYQVVSFNNALWLLGGDDDSPKNDIWKSTDGTTWTQVDANGDDSGLNAPWSARYSHQVVSHNNAMWLLGGYDGSYKNDIWKSTNGTTWTQVDSNGSDPELNAPWSLRGDSQVVSFNNALWLLGGDNDDSPKNDIWKSTDETTWTQIDANRL